MSGNSVTPANPLTATDLLLVSQGKTRSFTKEVDLATLEHFLTPSSLLGVKAYGAVGDGVIDDTVAINSAITAASGSPYGGEVYFPPGLYRVRQNGKVGAIRPRSNTVLVGAGADLSVLWMDDSEGGTDMLGNNISNGPTYDPLENFHVSGLGFKGRADVVKTGGGQLIRVQGNNISFKDCTFSYSRNMGIVLTCCHGVIVTGCRVFRTIADGISAWDCFDVLISGNRVEQANDDAISAHSNDDAPLPVRSGIVITDNIILDSQGIAVLGAKSLIISNNVLHRIMGTGIRVVNTPTAFVQGQTTQHSVLISNNIINDVFLRSETNPRNQAQFYILITGGTRQAGDGTSIPGEPLVNTGVAASLYGTGSGNFYNNDTSDVTVPAAGGHWMKVTDNILTRTLPAVAAVSDWGYLPEGQWVGDNGDGTGFYDGAISAAALQTTAIYIDRALKNTVFSGNIINTSGVSAIYFRDTHTTLTLDYLDVLIERNTFSNYITFGVRLPGGTTIQRMIIRDNTFDSDPYHIHVGRKSVGRDGSWLASGSPNGIYAINCGGLFMERNVFRNTNTAITYSGGISTLRDNIQVGTVAGLNFNTGNKGCGAMAPNGPGGWITLWEDADPTSATYGRVLSELVRSTSVMPTTGFYTRGHIVENSNPTISGGKVLLGWRRMTSGSNHVLNTDWAATYSTTT